MNNQILEHAEKLGIRRLCHFTSARNLQYMLKSGQILDRATLDKLADQSANPTDSERFDGHRDKVCCSIEYPNAYYLDVAARNDPLFLDWVVLFLNPRLLGVSDTMFCMHNAAKNRGAQVEGGFESYAHLFAPNVGGRARRTTHLKQCPTDLQAEVLVPGPIPMNEVIGMAMRTEQQVNTERVRWNVLGITEPTMPIFVAPTLYEKLSLRNHVWRGETPEEVRYG